MVTDSPRGRALLIAAGIAILLLAFWLRDPSIPYASEWSRASSSSATQGVRGVDARRRAMAIEQLRTGIAHAERDIRQEALRALAAPASPDAAFDFLASGAADSERGIVIIDNGVPIAWSGKFRTDPRIASQGASVTSTAFYTALNFSVTRGRRRVVTTALLHAEPPANFLSRPLDASIDARDQVESFSLGRASDEAAGEVVRDGRGSPLLRVDATPLPPEMLQFNRREKLQARGSLFLGLAFVVFLAMCWTDRRHLGTRIFALSVAAVMIAVVPWNNFSNVSRAFDPAYYFLRNGGPFTASAGAVLMSSIIAALTTFALIRSRRVRLPRGLAAVTAVALAAIGILAGVNASSGVALTPTGTTPFLWLIWEIPVFLLLFSFWLAAWWLGRLARGRAPTVHLGVASVVALIAGTAAVLIVWQTTTRQRLTLATRDIAGLQHADRDAANLLRRFGDELSGFDSPGTRADLLKRYADSDLAPAALQVSLAAWSSSVVQTARLDIAPLLYDQTTIVAAVGQAMLTKVSVIAQSLGPTGRQVILAAPHPLGGVTTAVVSPKTRLVASDPFAALLGLAPTGQNHAPYTLTIDPFPMQMADQNDFVRWRRIGDEWQGDQLIETSRGPLRARAEVDLRSVPTRFVRACLTVILNVAVAGLLWALGAMAEGGFFRWVRGRAWKWIYSYRGRLTLALFMFFVVPAIAFGAWSYRRLRTDDREVRELLVRETLSAASARFQVSSPSERVGGTPLFAYVGGLLQSSSDPLYEQIAPAGLTLPGPVYRSIARGGELDASWQQSIGSEKSLWGYRAVAGGLSQLYVIAAPARSDELVLDRRRGDLTMLVLFATAAGGLAALWLSGIAAKRLARDLELSRIEVARAERVLAWGEMARQVAHEIKNPLTPIRLGVQHLRRARLDNRVDFDRVLDENVTRILSEIDRLDEIARAFSRYGSAPADLPAAECVDVAAILRSAVGLEKIGIGDVSWTLQGAEGAVFGEARTDELREVLLNVFENARLARARTVTVVLREGTRTLCIEISDDGSGISLASLPRVFEPHFSTRTAGSGLGLAISRRLLESWGATIDIASEVNSGTRVTITLQKAAL